MSPAHVPFHATFSSLCQVRRTNLRRRLAQNVEATNPTMLIKSFLPYGISALAFIGSGAAWKEAGRSCILGVMGTETSVTVSGWRAVDVCQSAVTAEPSTYYLRETPPLESVIC